MYRKFNEYLAQSKAIMFNCNIRWEFHYYHNSAIDDIDGHLNQFHVIHINDQFDIHQIYVQKERLDISDAIVFIGPNFTDVFPGFFKY